MTKAIEKLIVSLFDFLPKRMSVRTRFVFVVTFPMILFKILKKTYFVNKIRRERQPFKNNLEPNKIVQNSSRLSLNNLKSKKICIRFSGGVDSTYIAAVMSEYFSEIHLLTFDTSERIFSFGLISSYPENSINNFNLLQKKFPDTVFKHCMVDFKDLREEIFFRDYQPKFKNKDFLRVLLCPSCTIAMHIKTIIYCLKVGIKYITDGANLDSGVFPWQTQFIGNLKLVQTFYAKFNLNYIINPYYDKIKTDKYLTDLGLMDRKYSRHFYPYRRKTQQFCIPIQLQSLCLKFNKKPEDTYLENTAPNNGIMYFFKDNIDYYENFISKHVSFKTSL